jgi:hypothetical protein
LRAPASPSICTSPGNTRGHGPAPLDDEQRFAALRRLLHDRDIDPRDRFAGCLLLLYAQPLTRIAALRISDIAATPDGQITITLARGAVALPEPLGSLAHALRDQRLANAGSEGWLLPGRNAGSHITAARATRAPEALRDRQPPRPPWRAAGARRPAARPNPRRTPWLSPIARVRAAGTTYADYVALRHTP